MSSSKRTKAVAIDGPAGSGKSTVSRLVAERLGFIYIDTGAMYRALTLKVMREDVPMSDDKGIVKVSDAVDIKLLPAAKEKNTIKVILDGKDVSEDIRTLEVTTNVKHVCKIPAVRERMVRLQQKMAADSDKFGTVMEGRDIGTVVLPDAKYKFYLDASFNERVERRLAELRAKGQAVTHAEVADDLKERDHTDKTREVGPLKKAEDAILIDTTNLTIDDVVVRIVGYVMQGENKKVESRK